MQIEMDRLYPPEPHLLPVLVTNEKIDRLPGIVHDYFSQNIRVLDPFVVDQFSGSTLTNICTMRNALLEWGLGIGAKTVMLCDADTVVRRTGVQLPTSGYGVPKVYWQKTARETLSESLHRIKTSEQNPFSVGNSWFMVGDKLLPEYRFNTNMYGYGWQDKEFDHRVKSFGNRLDVCDILVVHNYHEEKERNVVTPVFSRNELYFNSTMKMLRNGIRVKRPGTYEVVDRSKISGESSFILLSDDGGALDVDTGHRGRYTRQGYNVSLTWEDQHHETLDLEKYPSTSNWKT